MDPASISAFVPGHITGCFTTVAHDDPERAGSRGAGITVSDGVTVRMEPAHRSAIRLNGEPLTVEPVDRALAALDVSAAVDATSALPMGAGFGVSGALTLGTALVANAVFDRQRSENELITLAHRAEVRARTGLGDVVAQARGGMPIRIAAGGAAHNELDAIPAAPRVEYLSMGTLSTAAVIGGDTDRINDAGTRALDRIIASPTSGTFMRAAHDFTEESGVCPEKIASAITDVGTAGGVAAMAMLGRTVFAFGSDLSDAGFDPRVCSTHTAGATLNFHQG